jgi:hypothetical protein
MLHVEKGFVECLREGAQPFGERRRGGVVLLYYYPRSRNYISALVPTR